MTELLRQWLRFAAVGVLNTAVGLGAIYALMFFWDAKPVLANVGGYAIGLTVSFAFNRSWTFGSRRSVSDVLPKYLAVVAASYVLNLASVVAATASRAPDNPYMAQLLGIGIYTVGTFFGCRWFVFPPLRQA